MKSVFTLILLMISAMVFSQNKKKYDLDVVANIDAKFIAMQPIGNNAFAKYLRSFYGFGFGGNLMTPINFGIGLDVNFLYSNVIYGKENLYGSIASPVINSYDIYLTHRSILSEEFFTEEMAGFTFYRQINLFTEEKNTKNINLGNGLNFGAKLVYVLTEPQQVFLAAKFNTYKTSVFNENPEIENFYNHSYFLSLSLGYRYQF